MENLMVLWRDDVLAVWQPKRYTAGGPCHKNRRIKPLFNIKDTTNYREGTFSYILYFGILPVSQNLISVIELILMKRLSCTLTFGDEGIRISYLIVVFHNLMMSRSRCEDSFSTRY